MEIKYVIPNMEEIFGNFEYAGESEIEQHHINDWTSVINTDTLNRNNPSNV